MPGVLCAGRRDTVLSPLTVCSSTMAAMGPGDRVGAGPGGMAVCLSGSEVCISTTTHNGAGPNRQQTLVRRRKEDETRLFMFFSLFCFISHSALSLCCQSLLSFRLPVNRSLFSPTVLDIMKQLVSD